MGRSVRRDEGFTIVEVMIVVAIIGILAGIMIFAFTGQTNRVRSKSEVQAMFAELHRVEGEYATEHGTYLATGADASDIFPGSPSTTAQDVTAPPTEWTTLHVSPQSTKLYCGYVVAAGAADDDIPDFATDFGMTQPTGNWYAMFAECNQDNNATLDATFFASSTDTKMQSRNESH
jgi:prepilin-type N-terminal cleavage/methylation domain-containing protein